MKFLMLALALSSSTALAADWTVYDAEHPLWKAMNVRISGQFKTVGGVTCRRISGIRLSTTCTFPEKTNPEKVYEFYKILNVAPVATSGAYTEIKIVGRLIVVGDSDEKYNDSRFYLDHACRSIANAEQAAACMEFWAHDVLPSFEEANDVAVVEAGQGVKEEVAQTLAWNGYKKAKISERLKAIDGGYIGLMQEHQDEHHLYYYAIQNGEDVVPQEILDMNVADLDYIPLAEEAKGVEKKSEKIFVDRVLETLLLGQDRDLFGHFAEGIEEGLQYIIGHNAEN